MGIVDDYLEYTLKWKKEYGEKILVLLQVGSFFEVYGLRDEKGNICGSNILDFSNICDMMVSAKSQSINNQRVMMAGFGLAQLDKYIHKLQNAGYTVPIYKQDMQSKNTSRSLAEIVSPGTFFDDSAISLSNNTMCVWLHKSHKTRYSQSLMHIGISTIDSSTGRSYINEFSRDCYLDSSTFDDLERIISITKPYECVIVSNMDTSYIEEIVGFVGLSDTVVHIVDKRDKTDSANNACNAEKQVYQQKTMTKIFPQIAGEIIADTFRTHEFAMQSFTMLIDFVYQHRPTLLSKISFPEIENSEGRLLLANHSLRQLNIIDDSRHSGKFSSVSSLLNNCITSMGKRAFLYSITTPITDCDKLTTIYETTEYCIEENVWESIRSELSAVKDIERFVRKLALNKTSPRDIASFYDSLKAISIIYNSISKYPVILEQINKNNIVCATSCDKLICLIEETLDIDKSRFIDDISAERLGTMTPNVACFVKQGRCTKIDLLLSKSVDSSDNFEEIKNILSNLISSNEKSSRTKEFVKIHETAKTNPTLMCTKRRSVLLKSAIQKKYKDVKEINIKNKNKEINLDIGSFSFDTLGSNKKDVCINSPYINSVANNIQNSRGDLIHSLNVFYNEFTQVILNEKNDLDKIISFVSWADELQNRCYTACKFNYCKPTIDPDASKAFVNIEGLRHPLIEQLQTRELYVSNDIGLGDEKDGMLLYGTNAVGKTSLIRALGISVVLAQAGMYVPCKTMVYKPYTKIFTRIIGNDNLFKGLSTFAVEMSELRTILTLCDKNSLIMGDELCSGTESDSARSIFTAGLEWLHNTNSTFLFATHFHEIQNYSEVSSLDRLTMKHMAVTYDEKSDKLVYDRRLRDGPGANMYGLEVCKSLNLPGKFLTRAHEIRVKYDVKSEKILSAKQSRYNSKKLRGSCELCGGAGDEVHHLHHQVEADKNGYIDGHHKNHPANLLNICEICHDKIHTDGTRYRMAKSTDGYILVEE